VIDYVLLVKVPGKHHLFGPLYTLIGASNHSPDDKEAYLGKECRLDVLVAGIIVYIVLLLVSQNIYQS
jgi:hypothetical protein